MKLIGYTNLSTLQTTPSHLVCRAFSETRQQNVFLKILSVKYPTPEQLHEVEQEYQMLREPVGQGIPRALGLERSGETRLIVFEDFVGQILDSRLARNFSLIEKLKVAVSITRALAALQNRGIIFRDLRTENILVDVKSQNIQFMNLGLARRLDKIHPTDSIEGQLQYISPEQTGQTKTEVDYRTDYYSLGVTLYELFVGRLPFLATDEMEWVHSHIAVTETPPHEIDSTIPASVSMVIQKLLRKAPEERYQSCLGLLEDWKLCLEMAERECDVADFKPGNRDVSAQFRLSTKLYGRDEEIRLVDQVLTNVIHRGQLPRNTGTKLDLNTILKATNTLISEINMDQLVQKMLNILIENAGAERGVFFLMEGHALVVKGDLSARSREPFTLTSIPLDDYKKAPHTMMSYVVRTHEPMVLENASEDDRLARDEYVRENKILSAVALPILQQGEVKGVVYLDNNSAKGVFSPERVELMKALAGQIAISMENSRLYQLQAKAIRMQSELATAQAVQEMLFPESRFECSGVRIVGYFQPATECGGDWWCHSKIGDWIYLWMGDATGHGAPAALVTSAVCSAVSLLEGDPNLTPEYALEVLNKAVYRTTKGRIYMTFFVAALNQRTGELKYARASHEMPLLLRKANMDPKTKLRKAIQPLLGGNGAPLGERPDGKYRAEYLQLEPGDKIVLFTDGLPELRNDSGAVLGERGFWTAIFNSCLNEESLEASKNAIIEKVNHFRGQSEPLDDITLCLVEYTGSELESIDSLPTLASNKYKYG